MQKDKLTFKEKLALVKMRFKLRKTLKVASIPFINALLDDLETIKKEHIINGKQKKKTN